MTHITDGETTEGSVLSESLNAHGLGGDEGNDGSVTGLDELGVLLDLLTGTTVNLGLDVGELASDMGGMAIKDGGVAVGNLTGVVEDDNLGGEVAGLLGGVAVGVGADVATTDFLDGNILNVETNVVSGDGLGKSFMMHLNGLYLSGNTAGSEGSNASGLEDTSLDTTDGHRTDTTDLVDVLEGKTKSLVDGALRGIDRVESVDKSGALVPGHVGGLLEHVVTVPSGNGDKGDLVGVVSDLEK